MKYNYIKLFVLTIIGFQFSFSQQLPIDFSYTSDTFNNWGGSSFAIINSPTDSNNKVGQFTRSASAGSQGQYIDLTKSIDLNVEDEITLNFYAFDAYAHNIVVKLEQGVNADIEMSVNASASNSWNALIFDFSTVGGSGTYNRLTIRIDDGSTVSGSFLIDGINDGSIAIDPNAIDVEYTSLVWSDEFDDAGTTAVNPTRWYHQTYGPNGGRWYNNEEQHYTNRIDNSFVSGGNLNIVAKKESFTQNGVTLQYTSARLNSKFAFTYGRVDVRAKLPAGNGTWPAIWTLGKNVNEIGAYWQSEGFGTTGWPACGEIDIMEHGLGAVNHTSSALHTPSSSGNTVNVASQLISDVANNFHVYSMNWSPNQITFLVDGVGYYTYNPSIKNSSTWPFDKDQYLLLNVALGGISGAIDAGYTQSDMVIDYVRVYQANQLSVESFNTDGYKVFPNPANTVINIASQAAIDRVELYDIYGKLVLHKTQNTDTINIDNLNSGIYMLGIYSGVNRIYKKVFVN